MRIGVAIVGTTALIWAIAAGALALVVQPMVAPVASTPPPVDPARLEQHVRKLAVALYPRSFDQFAHLDAAARYIAAGLTASGGRVEIQEVKVGQASYHNIIARFGPAQGPLMVIGAHYDSAAATPVPPPSRRTPTRPAPTTTPAAWLRPDRTGAPAGPRSAGAFGRTGGLYAGRAAPFSHRTHGQRLARARSRRRGARCS
ncbi:hypothetical protein LP419_32005 [Massilia sp. H-1]|nr:hypothetical protein LP419_32005 [Massilia sp. H-1]